MPQGQRRLVSQRSDQLLLRRAKGLGREAVVEIDGAAHATMDRKRHTEHGAQTQLVNADLFAETIIVHRVEGDRRPSAGQHLLGDGAADLELLLADRLLIDVARDADAQRAAIR